MYVYDVGGVFITCTGQCVMMQTILSLCVWLLGASGSPDICTTSHLNITACGMLARMAYS